MQIKRLLGISIFCGGLLIVCCQSAQALTFFGLVPGSMVFKANEAADFPAAASEVPSSASFSAKTSAAHNLSVAGASNDTTKHVSAPDSQGRTLEPGEKRIYLFAVMVLVSALLLKVLLIYRHSRSGKPSCLTSREIEFPPHNFARRHIPGKTVADKVSLAHGLSDTPHETSERQAPDEAVLSAMPSLENSAYGKLIEGGHLADIRVPALFKQWATSREPVQMVITRAASEKRFYLCDGAIYCSLARNNRYDSDNEGRAQLLYMLTRDDLINARDRDRAIYQVENGQQPDIVSALLETGVVSEAELRTTMERQATISVFSLILFPEGDYRIFTAAGNPPGNGDFSLEVKGLISEAARHRKEWTAIRRALPTLESQLIFSPHGRDKLDQVQLSIQQQLILTQIDGLATVADLCESSVMIDYEIYRFLYMMLKAGVLELTKPSS